MKKLSELLKIPRTVRFVRLPEQPAITLLKGTSDGIYPVREPLMNTPKSRYYINAVNLADNKTRVLSLSEEFWEELKAIMERDRLIESQKLAVIRFKQSKLRYRK